MRIRVGRTGTSGVWWFLYKAFNVRYLRAVSVDIDTPWSLSYKP